MKKIALLLLGMAFLCMLSAEAQVRRITGVVTSAEDGNPIPGVSVVVKGTTLGTITSIDGNYQVDVPGDAETLVFSFVGMKTVEQAITGTVINVVLSSDISELDEIMVVAYGTTTKGSFTGSAGVVKSEMIEKNQSSNITNNIAGKVAGVQSLASNGQPGQGSTIRIRGIGSMSASNAPLYVVDGVPYDTNISSISNSDIESITVLKDASSAALYGARGANGVVIITTKRGSSKGKDAKIQVETKWGNNQRSIPSYNVMTDPGMYYESFYRALYNSKVAADGSKEAHSYASKILLDASNGGLGYQVYTIPKGQMLIGDNFKLNPNAVHGYSDGNNTYMYDNWYDEIFKKNNLRQEYNVNINGSSDKITYFASGNYLDDSGIIENSDFKRFSTRLNADYQAKEWLKIVTNMSYVRVDSRYPDAQVDDRSSGNLFFVSNMLAPVYPLYIRDASGNIMTDARGYTMYDYGDGTIVDAKRPFMSQSNPASALMLNVEKLTTNYFIGKWSAVAELYDGLKATATVGLTTADTRSATLMNPYYGQFADGGGYISVYNTNFLGLNQQYLLTYDKRFGLHNIDVLAGIDSYNYKSSVLRGFKRKIFQDRVPEINNAILEPSTSSYTNSYATLGYLGQLKYDYESKYFATFSFRRDGSSMFAPENRWGNFWSVGAAWDLSSEGFLSNAHQIDMLKFKISYGAQGNDKLYYSGTSTVNYKPYADQYDVTENNGEFATSRSYVGNRDITWETSHNFNAGFDFSFFDQYLNGTIEGFSRTTEDMLYYKPVSPSSGYSFLPMNIGSISNYGLEVDLNTDVIRSNSLTWNLYANLTYFKNKIKKLHPDLEGEWISGSYIYKEGNSMYNFYLREYAGVDEITGSSLWYFDKKDSDGNITKSVTDSWSNATQYEQGDILPKIYGGFGTTVTTFGFDVSVDFAYQMGGKNLDNTYMTLMHGGYSSDAGRNWHTDILDAWTPDNPNSNIPKLNSQDQYTNSTSTRFLISSDYLSLQNVTVGYTFPKRFLERFNVEKLRIFAVADNVALLTARTGLDPRQSYSVAYSGSLYTPIRSISGGLNITF